MKRPTIEDMYMKMAELVSQRSTCSRLKVGAILTDAKMRNVESYGYNGNYSGGPNHCDSKEPGNCGCLHAEVNALIKAGKDAKIMFITDSPCKMCAKAIVNKDIERVYYHREYRVKDGIEILKKSKIKVIKI